MTALSILDVQHLTKTYDTGAGKLTVLKDISFTLPAGSTCSILGPSGSGKTTLLGLCAGLDRPTSGSVLLNGITLGEEDTPAPLIRDRFGAEYVFTDNEHTNFMQIVEDSGDFEKVYEDTFTTVLRVRKPDEPRPARDDS